MRFCDLSADRCVPFVYSTEATKSGSYIGGNPPNGVYPAFKTVHQKYFGTLLFDEFGLSIFYSLEIPGLGQDEEIDIITFNNQLLVPSNLIHVVTHRETENVPSGVPVEISNHDLHFRDAIQDSVMDEEGASFPDSQSKLGGKPYIENHARRTMHGSDKRS